MAKKKSGNGLFVVLIVVLIILIAGYFMTSSAKTVISPAQNKGSSSTSSTTNKGSTTTNNSSTATTTKTGVGIGSKGATVKRLQTALNRHGAGLNVDGAFGKFTAEALKKLGIASNFVSLEQIKLLETMPLRTTMLTAVSDAITASGGNPLTVPLVALYNYFKS